jgi:hypothetical protein
VSLEYLPRGHGSHSVDSMAMVEENGPNTTMGAATVQGRPGNRGFFQGIHKVRRREREEHALLVRPVVRGRMHLCFSTGSDYCGHGASMEENYSGICIAQ